MQTYAKNSSKPNIRKNSVLFRLIIIILLIGIFFRFFNLDKKLYWIDEAYTSLRIAGHTEAEIRPQFFEGEILSNKDMHKYQHLNPDRGVIDTLKSLAAEDAQHPPLYYLMLRYWRQWFGNSVIAIRSLSAFISLLIFLCLYWLCTELFKSPNVTWVAIAIIAISPFHVLYAQEAREYGLWTITILLSSAALLWAMRVKTRISWITYALTVVLGLYTYIFTGLIVVGHGIYVIAIEQLKLTKPLKKYLLASVVGLIAFVPWILVVLNSFNCLQSTTSWMNEKTNPLSLITRWAGNLSRIFLDLGVDANDSLSSTIFLIPLILILLVLVGYSIYFLIRTTPKRVWLFILTLVAVTPIVLMVPDLIVGGRRSGTARYLIPSYLGIQITVAYLLATKINPISRQIRQQKRWKLIAIALVLSGILSCAVSSQAEEWWNKGTALDPSIPKMARTINQANQPLLILEERFVPILLSFSYQLEPKVGLRLVKTPNTLEMPKEFNDIFVYKPSEALREELEKNHHYVLKPIQNLGRFKDNLVQLEM